jgi:hypothetical protein
MLALLLILQVDEMRAVGMDIGNLILNLKYAERY